MVQGVEPVFQTGIIQYFIVINLLIMTIGGILPMLVLRSFPAGSRTLTPCFYKSGFGISIFISRFFQRFEISEKKSEVWKNEVFVWGQENRFQVFIRKRSHVAPQTHIGGSLGGTGEYWIP